MATRKQTKDKFDVPDRQKSLETENIRLRSIIRALQKEMGEGQILNDDIKALVERLPPVKVRDYPRPKSHSNGELVATINGADQHCEEAVDPRETQGLYTYNWETYLAREWATAQKVVEMADTFRNGYTIDKLVVKEHGDYVTGEIHADLQRTNTKYLPEAIVWAGWVMAQRVRYYAANFQKVEVYCVAGNHGRMDKKPPYKQKSGRNWDTSVYMQAALHTKDIENITWHIPMSPMLTVPIIGKWAELIDHGDEVKSHSGVTPYYGMIREYAGAIEERAGREDLRFQVLSFGHYHHEAWLEERIQVVPSLKGPDQYSQRRVHYKGQAAQLMTFYNEKYGRQFPCAIKLQHITGKTGHGFETIPMWQE